MKLPDDAAAIHDSIQLVPYDAAEFIEPLESIGYSYWRGNPKPWHFYFVKGLPLAGGTGRTHHVHVYEKNRDEFRDKILFRNYLMKNLEVAQQYLQLKIELARKFPSDREAYTNGKAEFVSKVLQRAR